MSLTLPYASAVNCKFVALPDSLATNDNTLKLYNIDGGGGGGTTNAYTKAESDARFLRLAAPSQTISQIPNSAGIRMNSGAFLDWLFGATGTSQPFRFKAANGGTVNFYVSSPADLDSRNIFIPQISTGNVFFLVDRPTNTQTIYKSTLNLDYTGGTASSSAMLIKGYGAGLGNGLDFLASTQTSGTRHIRFYAAPASLRGEVYDNGSGMCYQGNEANVNKLTLNGNSVTDIVTTVTGTSDSKVPSEKAVKTYVDAAGIPKTDIVTTVTGVSDSKVASEKAVKTYVDSKIPASNNYYTCIYTTWSHPWSGTAELTDINPNLDGYGIRTFSFRLVGENLSTGSTSIIRHFISYPNTRYTIRINGTYKPETLTFRVPFKRMYIVETSGDGTVTYCVANTEVPGEDFVNTDFEQLAFEAGGTGLNLVGITGKHSLHRAGVGQYEVKFLAAPI